MNITKFKTITVILILVFITDSIRSQTSIDSLKRELSMNMSDTDRVFTMHEIGMEYYLTHPDSAIKFWRMAIAFSDKALQTKKGKQERNAILRSQSYSLGGLAFMMDAASKQDSAVLLNERSLKNFMELKDTKGAAEIMINLSSYYSDVANYEKAIELSKQVIELSGKSKEYGTLGFAYQNAGLSYFNWGNVPMAIEYFQRSLKVRDSIKDIAGLGHAYYELAIIYRSQKETKEALDYFLKSYDCRNQGKDMAAIGATENELAALYMVDLKDYTSSKRYLEQSRKHLEEAKAGLRLGFLYANYGTYYALIGNLDSSLFYHKKALEKRKETGEIRGYYLSLYQMGKTNYLLKNYAKAIEFALQAYEGGVKLNSVDLIKKSADVLRSAYSATGNWKQAYYFYDLFKINSDSLFNAENQRLGIKNRMNYEFEKKKEIMKAQQEKEMLIVSTERDKQKMKTLYSLILFLIATGFSVFIFNRFRLIKKQKQIIEVQKQEVILQKDVIEEKQKEILDSIHYALRIQKALLTNEKYFDKNLKRLQS